MLSSLGVIPFLGQLVSTFGFERRALLLTQHKQPKDVAISASHAARQAMLLDLEYEWHPWPLSHVTAGLQEGWLGRREVLLHMKVSEASLQDCFLSA